jgi:hypothetical protein
VFFWLFCKEVLLYGVIGAEGYFELGVLKYFGYFVRFVSEVGEYCSLFVLMCF